MQATQPSTRPIGITVLAIVAVLGAVLNFVVGIISSELAPRLARPAAWADLLRSWVSS